MHGAACESGWCGFSQWFVKQWCLLPQGETAPVLLDGLSKLEYRGYDSAGIAVYDGNKIQMQKAMGRLKVLEEMTQNGATLPGTVGIGHTCILPSG